LSVAQTGVTLGLIIAATLRSCVIYTNWQSSLMLIFCQGQSANETVVNRSIVNAGRHGQLHWATASLSSLVMTQQLLLIWLNH